MARDRVSGPRSRMDARSWCCGAGCKASHPCYPSLAPPILTLCQRAGGDNTPASGSKQRGLGQNAALIDEYSETNGAIRRSRIG